MPLIFALLAIATAQADPLDALVPAGVHPTLVEAGFKFLEGPAWTRDGKLIFSDILADTIYTLKGDHAISFLHPSRRSIGNTVDPEGRIVSCEQETRSVRRREHNGHETVLASNFDGLRLNSPDDVVVRSDGTVYFTDPSFAVKPQDKQLTFDGVFRIPPNGKPVLESRDFAKPNGLAFSPDEKLLYVNDTVRRQIRVFDVLASGALANERFFAVLTGEMAGMANGMKVDAKGDVFCTGPGGIQVFSPVGRYLGVIFLPKVVNNFCFGDADRKTLYITTTNELYKLRLKVAGAR